MSTRPPLIFVTSLRASGAEAVVEASSKQALKVGPPPEFGGQDDVWSPEHLLLASVSSCFFTTLRAIASRSKVNLRGLTCRATGQVEKTKDGMAFTKIDLAVDVDVDPGVFSEAHQLVESAKRWCLVTRSLACPVIVSSIVTTSSRNSAGAVELT